MTITSDPMTAITALRKAGKIDEAVGRLRDALRRGQFDAEGVDKAGRLLRKIRPPGAKAPKVLLLGQFTTSWLVNTLTAVAFGNDVDLAVSEGGYDNVIQDLATLALDAAPDYVVLLPWTSRIFSGDSSIAERVERELEFWRQAWDLASRLGSTIVQVGYDWVMPDALGHHLGRRDGTVGLVRRVNDRLAESLPPGAFFVDLEQISGLAGRAAFYDMRRYFWTKQPLSEAGAVLLAEHLWAGVRSVLTGPKKVLVLDLDNTLWGGVVGELGPLGIALGESADGEAFRAFQSYCKALSKRGVLLALASKNNLADAQEPFTSNPDMVLSLDDFAATEICWEPKGTTIARMAQTLNLGSDSFVFFDDNPAEREQVRQSMPEVAVVDVPEDPAEYVRALQSGLWFEAVNLTGEDRARAEQYAVERKRRDLQQSFGTMDDYLRSLEMVAELRPIDEVDLGRVVQLLGKTNQFNLTTRRHSIEDVKALLARPNSIGLTLRIRDKFGDHGLVGVVIAVPDESRPGALRIDTWLMSCRVIARTVEEFQYLEILRRAAALGYREVIGEYIPTKKNLLVAELLDRMGLSPLPADGDSESKRYVVELEAAKKPVSFVQLAAVEA